jgi:hypothetical protein
MAAPRRATPTIVHVIPTGDRQPHVESFDCPCEPRLEPADVGDGLRIVHHRYDGRDVGEREAR